MKVRILCGDCRNVLRSLPEQSVHCVVTSPPYWGLRDYGGWRMCTMWGEAADFLVSRQHPERWLVRLIWRAGHRAGGVFSRNKRGWIGALGLEPTPDLYVAHLVKVFQEVRRVLRDDGSLWLNLGDSYATTPPGNKGFHYGPGRTAQGTLETGHARHDWQAAGLKPKDLVGIPWRAAFALQADGWYLRSAMPWLKRSAMPEAVRDRPTTALEYVFLLTKRGRYYWDAEAVRRPQTGNAHSRGRVITRKQAAPGTGVKANSSFYEAASHYTDVPGGRSMRNSDFFCHSLGMILAEDGSPLALDVNPNGFNRAHFATFPPALVEPMVKAGTSERGVCPACGAPWARVVERTDERDTSAKGSRFDKGKTAVNGMGRTQEGERYLKQTIGWRPTCECGGAPVSATVLDPFGGAGTTGLVAARLMRDAVLIDANAEYCEMARARIAEDMGMLVDVQVD